MEKLKIRVKDAVTGKVLAYEWLECSKWKHNLEGQIAIINGLYSDPFAHVIRKVFTGKKDNEGVEVYEGDIVQTSQGTGVVKRQGCEFFIDLHSKDVSLSLSEYSVKVVAKKDVPIDDVVKQVLENLAESPIGVDLTINDLKNTIEYVARLINDCKLIGHVNEKNEAVLRLAAICLHTSKIIQENEQ